MRATGTRTLAAAALLAALATAPHAALAAPATPEGETAVPAPNNYQAGAQQSAQRVKKAVSQKVGQAIAASSALVPGAQATAKAPKKASPGALAHAPKTTEERHLLNREVYVYKTVGRRDPFASLLTGEFETTVGRPLLDVSSMKLVGIVWGSGDKFALVEDGRGHGHVLRVGDPVINGSVVGLTKEELMIRQSSYGDTQTVTIQLQRKEGGSDE